VNDKITQAIRGTQYAPTFYNDEQALRYVIKFAYIAAVVIELKWNKSPEGAVHQIRDRDYPAVLKDYGGEVVIVGIGYDAKKKEHSCVIERV